MEKEREMEKRGGTMGSDPTLSLELRWGLTPIVYYLLFVVFVSGCARGGDVISTPKKYIEITLAVEGKIDSSSGAYLIVFDANDKYPEGPYFDDEDNLYNWTDKIMLKDNVFRLVHLEEEGGETFLPFQQGAISDKEVIVTIDLEELLGNPTKLDLNLFTTDSGGKPLDALGEGEHDPAAYISLEPITTGCDQPISDFSDDCEEVDFNITGGRIRVMTY